MRSLAAIARTSEPETRQTRRDHRRRTLANQAREAVRSCTACSSTRSNSGQRHDTPSRAGQRRRRRNATSSSSTTSSMAFGSCSSRRTDRVGRLISTTGSTAVDSATHLVDHVAGIIDAAGHSQMRGIATKRPRRSRPSGLPHVWQLQAQAHDAIDLAALEPRADWAAHNCCACPSRASSRFDRALECVFASLPVDRRIRACASRSRTEGVRSREVESVALDRFDEAPVLPQGLPRSGQRGARAAAYALRNDDSTVGSPTAARSVAARSASCRSRSPSLTWK